MIKLEERIEDENNNYYKKTLIGECANCQKALKNLRLTVISEGIKLIKVFIKLMRL